MTRPEHGFAQKFERNCSFLELAALQGFIVGMENTETNVHNSELILLHKKGEHFNTPYGNVQSKWRGIED